MRPILGTVSTPRTYPAGVPSWIDTEQPDLDEARRFYGELFGWTFQTVTPPSSPAEYVVARLGGRDVAGLGSAGGADEAAWNTYIAVADVDAAAKRIEEAGGQIR